MLKPKEVAKIKSPANQSFSDSFPAFKEKMQEKGLKVYNHLKEKVYSINDALKDKGAPFQLCLDYTEDKEKFEVYIFSQTPYTGLGDQTLISPEEYENSGMVYAHFMSVIITLNQSTEDISVELSSGTERETSGSLTVAQDDFNTLSACLERHATWVSRIAIKKFKIYEAKLEAEIAAENAKLEAKETEFRSKDTEQPTPDPS